MLLSLLVISVVGIIEAHNETEILRVVFGETFMFSNVMQLSLRFEITNDTEYYFHFVGETCSAYLYKNVADDEPIFELDIYNGLGHEVYTSPLADELFFEGYPFSINGNLMQLTSQTGAVECSRFTFLSFYATVTELIIADVVTAPRKAIYKEHESHLELLSLLATLPLCIIIFYLKREKSANQIGYKHSESIL